MSSKRMNPNEYHKYEENEEIGEIDKQKKKSKKKKRKVNVKRLVFRIFLILLIIILILAGFIFWYGYDKFSKINHDTSFDKNAVEINEGVSTTGYFNIMLFGVDARDQTDSYDSSLSDVIMVVSINQDTKKVKIASIYRDTYLQDKKTQKFDKITHAFLKGGPSLSMSTINRNLDLDITDYVAINFKVVIDVVDAVGGVTVDISKDEAHWINAYIDEMNKNTGHNSPHITKARNIFIRWSSSDRIC